MVDNKYGFLKTADEKLLNVGYYKESFWAEVKGAEQYINHENRKSIIFFKNTCSTCRFFSAGGTFIDFTMPELNAIFWKCIELGML